jgi:hypothetical protein
VRLGQSPFDRYYGDFASPLDFIFALEQLYACSGDKQQLNRKLLTNSKYLKNILNL